MTRLAYGQGMNEVARLSGIETDECVEWPYASASGYGVVWTGTRMNNVTRLSCEGAHGPPFDGADTAHSCHNPLCMNPRHLRWATRSENQLDRVKDGTDMRGEWHWGVRLTASNVLAIRDRAESGEKQRDLAREYGISVQHMSGIVNKKEWKWL